MNTPILTLASLNTMPTEPMDMAARRIADRLMALHRALFSFSTELVGEYFTPYTFIITRKELRCHMKRNGYKKYEITEELFPKKKKRGSMRRARRNKPISKMIGTLPGDVYIDEWDYKNDPHSVTDIEYDNDSIKLAILSHSVAAQDLKVGYRRTTNQIIDDFEPPMIPPISREEFMQKASFSAPFDVTDDQFDGDPVLIIPGPFDGEEEL